MKKILISIFLLLALWPAIAQQPAAQTEDVVQRFVEKVEKSQFSVDYSFLIEEKTRMTGKGSATVQKNAFKLQQNGLEVYSDGQTRWTVDRAAKEVVVEAESMETSSDNAISLLTEINTLFAVGPLQEGTFQNQSASYAILSAKQAGNVHLVKFYFRGEAPIGMIVTLSDDRVVEISFNRIGFKEPGKLTDFTFDTEHLDDSWIVNDLR